MVEREPVIFRGSSSASFRGNGNGNGRGGKPMPVARPGNIALDVARPLYVKGPNWKYTDYKDNLLTSIEEVKESGLPELHFLDGKEPLLDANNT
jgi:hypothetical protein